jgi:hypothetical protein
LNGLLAILRHLDRKTTRARRRDSGAESGDLGLLSAALRGAFPANVPADIEARVHRAFYEEFAPRFIEWGKRREAEREAQSEPWVI